MSAANLRGEEEHDKPERCSCRWFPNATGNKLLEALQKAN